MISIAALAVLGIVVAAGIGLLTNTIAGDSIGLSASPLEPGRQLAPPQASRVDDRRVSAHGGGAHRDETTTAATSTTTAPTTTTAAPTSATTAPEIGDDNGGSSGSSGPGPGDSGSSGSGSGGSGSSGPGGGLDD
jgi:hypothetical protein